MCVHGWSGMKMKVILVEGELWDLGISKGMLYSGRMLCKTAKENVRLSWSKRGSSVGTVEVSWGQDSQEGLQVWLAFTHAW